MSRRMILLSLLIVLTIALYWYSERYMKYTPTKNIKQIKNDIDTENIIENDMTTESLKFDTKSTFSTNDDGDNVSQFSLADLDVDKTDKSLDTEQSLE